MKQICNVEIICGVGVGVDVLLQQYLSERTGPGPVYAELIVSCQRFRWQAFIYQVVAFPWTWQSGSRCEGQQQSHILIKDQGAKNKNHRGGHHTETGGDVKRLRGAHVLIITHVRWCCCYA